MGKGIVYILTNPCLDGWVKIGMTERDDIEARLNELNSPTNLPLSFRCYATYKTDKPRVIEQNIHIIIDNINSSLRAIEQLDNGKSRKREFFRMSPEAAYRVLQSVASINGDIENLCLFPPTHEQSHEEEIAESRTRRSNNSFKLLGINIGEEISFLYDDNITARVLNNKNQIEYNGERYSVTALATKILIENYDWKDSLHINGWRFFTKDNVTLSDLRDEIEASEIEE